MTEVLSDEKMDIAERLAQLEAQMFTLVKLVADHQLDGWRPRVDNLAVQAKLGTMEVRDRVIPLLRNVQNGADTAVDGVHDVIGTIRDVVQSMRIS